MLAWMMDDDDGILSSVARTYYFGNGVIHALRMIRLESGRFLAFSSVYGNRSTTKKECTDGDRPVFSSGYWSQAAAGR